jgi:hypothetical protein
MTNPASPGVDFITGPDKADETSRIDRGVKVGSLAPQSPLYTKSADVKSAVDITTADTAALKAAVDNASTAEATAKKATTALALAMGTWDGSYAVLVATAQKYCASDNDGTSLGLEVRGTPTHNPLAMPIAVTLRQDFKKNLLRVHVQRAPGMDSVDIEISPDPITPTSWKLLDGNGARRAITLPGKGTWWVRAASRTASATSDYTTPVSIILV